MITENYVSLETAKLLKEKGFDEEVKSFYSYDSIFKMYNFEEDDRWDVPNNWGEYYWSAPTLQMTMKWLREVHNLSVDVFHHRDWNVNIKTIPDDYFQADYSYPELKPAETYEEACEAGIKYCLEKLI